MSETAHVAELFHSDVSSLHPLRLNETISLSQSFPLLPPFRYLLPLGMHCNQHEIVSVRLYRDKDSFFIPYTSIYGVTLISLLRLGLEKKQRERLFSSFLRLPLYEDMAPWNIVLMGKVRVMVTIHPTFSRKWNILTMILVTSPLIWTFQNLIKYVSFISYLTLGR